MEGSRRGKGRGKENARKRKKERKTREGLYVGRERINKRKTEGGGAWEKRRKRSDRCFLILTLMERVWRGSDGEITMWRERGREGDGGGWRGEKWVE